MILTGELTMAQGVLVPKVEIKFPVESTSHLGDW